MEDPTAVPGFSFRPVPAALISYRSAQGAPCVLATGWVGMICTRPATLCVSLKQPSPPELLGSDFFCINLLSEEMLAYCDPVPLQAASAADANAAGLTLQRGAAHDGPLIAECPVKMECRRIDSSAQYGQELLRGAMIAVHLGDMVYGLDDAPLDLNRIRPFTRCPNLPRVPIPALREPTFFN
ncbi:MAG: flavin reductase [Desulfuromonadales bacterium]